MRVKFRFKLIGNLDGPFHADSMAQNPYDVYYMSSGERVRAGGRALIPKNASGWPILAGFAKVGSFSCCFPIFNFYFLVGRWLGEWPRGVPQVPL